MITLRDYQAKAVEDLSQALRHHKTVVGVFPTASGKSAMIAEVCRRAVAKGSRVLVLVHQAEIIEQNHKWCTLLGVESGIYCASLKRKDIGSRVTHASRDSLGNKPLATGLYDLAIVDECHFVSIGAKTRYANILASVNPKKIIGFTGTPYRVDNGLIFGPKKYWEAVGASIPMQELFDRGYLCPYVLPKTEQIIDTKGIKTTAGDFNPVELEKRSSESSVVEKCLDQWEVYARGRRCTLVFCCSITHAMLVSESMERRGHKGRVLTGETNKEERAQIIKEIKDGKLDYVCNVAVLTTGVDLPIVDCILFLRATKSLALFIQMCGRALRLYEGKTSALMLDAAGNFERLGRPESPNEPSNKKDKALSWTDEDLLKMGIDPEQMKGETATKTCGNCNTVIPAQARSCLKCGDIFVSHTAKIATESGSSPSVFDVVSVHIDFKKSKAGNDMAQVTYLTATRDIVEYILLNHTSAYIQANIDSKIAKIKRGPSKISAHQENGFWRVQILA